VSVAVIVAAGVNTDGQREVLGLKVGASEAEPFWTEFLRSLNRRGLRGVKLVISDSHEGIKAAAAKVLKATWQRCRVHFMRNALAHAGKTQRRMVSAAIGTVFVQDSADAARAQWRSVADQLRDKFPKLGSLMDDAENDVLAFMTFPRAHWTQIYSTNPLERLNAEIKRRTNVVGIFPNDASITRLVGAMMMEQNDEWSLNRRYMQLLCGLLCQGTLFVGRSCSLEYHGGTHAMLSQRSLSVTWLVHPDPRWGSRERSSQCSDELLSVLGVDTVHRMLHARKAHRQTPIPDAPHLEGRSLLSDPCMYRARRP
jgi:hypothetical protein